MNKVKAAASAILALLLSAGLLANAPALPGVRSGTVGSYFVAASSEGACYWTESGMVCKNDCATDAAGCVHDNGMCERSADSCRALCAADPNNRVCSTQETIGELKPWKLPK